MEWSQGTSYLRTNHLLVRDIFSISSLLKLNNQNSLRKKKSSTNILSQEKSIKDMEDSFMKVIHNVMGQPTKQMVIIIALWAQLHALMHWAKRRKYNSLRMLSLKSDISFHRLWCKLSDNHQRIKNRSREGYFRIEGISHNYCLIQTKLINCPFNT